MAGAPAGGGAAAAPANPLAALRTRGYLVLLVLAALLGVPVSAAAWGFLALSTKAQGWVFTDLPKAVGFQGEPPWWPLLPLAAAGILVGLIIRYLPGRGGKSPADGFKAGEGAPGPAELPGVVLAALVTLSLGVVLGPEAPLIALGGGLGVIAVRLAKRDAPPRVTAMLAAAGSFAAVSALLGSPLLGAFLLMEASGLGGATLELVLVPGLLAAGIGSLTFIGLGSLTGLGTFSLSIPNLPHLGHPTGAEFGYAIGIGLAAALLGSGIRRLGLALRSRVESRLLLLALPAAGLVIAALAIVFAEITGHGSGEVLFSGENTLGPLITHGAAWSAGALVLLLVCKGLAYGLSLSGFRGGPTFPAMFLGAAGGMALSHLPGLPLVAGAAMGIGAMSAVMLRLPLTSVLLATLLLSSDGLVVMPLAIVAVVVSYVASARLSPEPAPAGQRPAPAGPAPAAPEGPAPPGAVPAGSRPPVR